MLRLLSEKQPYTLIIIISNMSGWYKSEMFKDYDAHILIFNMITTYQISTIVVSTAQVLTFYLFVPNELRWSLNSKTNMVILFTTNT